MMSQNSSRNLLTSDDPELRGKRDMALSLLLLRASFCWISSTATRSSASVSLPVYEHLGQLQDIVVSPLC